MNLGHFLSALACALALTACTAEPTPYDKPVERLIRTPPHAASAARAQSSSTASEAVLPVSALIDVPFSPQAPFGNWSLPYQEACEEMSLILVQRYLTNQPLTRTQADEELQRMVAWQLEHLGHYEDTTTDEVRIIAEKFYGRQTRMIDDPSVQDIKRLIANGHPVIIPTAGRELGNPFFTGEGPWYHMLVVIGYDEENFIVHDVGTKRGERYAYEQEHLVHTIHDWTGVKERIADGRRVALVVE